MWRWAARSTSTSKPPSATAFSAATATAPSGLEPTPRAARSPRSSTTPSAARPPAPPATNQQAVQSYPNGVQAGYDVRHDESAPLRNVKAVFHANAPRHLHSGQEGMDRHPLAGQPGTDPGVQNFFTPGNQPEA